MEKNLDKALNDFLGDEELEETKKKNTRNVVLQEREGLIERIDKIFVDKNGRQLLREVY